MFIKNFIFIITVIFCVKNVFATINPFAEIDAVEYSERSRSEDKKVGMSFVPDAYDNKKRVAFIHSGSWIRFDNVDFMNEDVQSVSVKITGEFDGEIQIKLDDIDNDPVAIVAIPKTGGWDNWRNISSPIKSTIKGTHNVYLHFTKQGFDVKSFVFSVIKEGDFASGLGNPGNACYLNSLFSILLNFPDWRPYLALENKYGEDLDLILNTLYIISNHGTKQKVSWKRMNQLLTSPNRLGYDFYQQDPFNDVLIFSGLDETFKEETISHRNHESLDNINYTDNEVNNIKILEHEKNNSNTSNMSYISLPVKDHASLNKSYLSYLEEEIIYPYGIRTDLTYRSIKRHHILQKNHPKYVLVHLQNADNDSNIITDEFKLSKRMNFNFSGQNEEYSLVAMIVHEGNKSTSGHYMSYILRRGKWYVHNDEMVSPIKEKNLDQVFNSSAYNKKSGGSRYPYLLLFSHSN